MSTKAKEYTNGEVTVVWKQDLCIHSANCVKGLPDVFDPKARPWITIEAASTEALVAQMKKCPSGALTSYMNAEGPTQDKSEVTSEQIVEIVPNGPLMVYGNLTVKHPDGSKEQKNKMAAFCRCGASSNKPYCDGTHKKIEFKG